MNATPPPVPPVLPSTARSRKGNKLGAKLAAIVVTIGLLLVGLILVDIKRHERAGRQQEAVADITGSWGGSQVVHGPSLLLPNNLLRDAEGEFITTVLPAALEIEAVLDPEIRSRGIYKAQVYKSRVTLRGHFELPETVGLPAGQRAHLMWELDHTAGVSLAAPLKWIGAEVPRTSMRGAMGMREGFLYAVHLETGRRVYAFELTFDLRGSDRFSVVPLARQGKVMMRSSAPSPSFGGERLPDTRSVTDDGFDAEWTIAGLESTLPSLWLSEADQEVFLEAQERNVFGVALLPGITDYRAVERAINYGALFLITIFTGLFLGEFLGGRPLHVLNYILVGAALCLFFLALLALAELVGFGWAYVVAALASVGMILSYARAVLASGPAVGRLATLLVGIYGYLYLVLRMEDLSLIAGTVLLFVLLGAVMYVTRHLRAEDV